MNYDQLLAQLQRDLPQSSMPGVGGWIALGAGCILAIIALWWLLHALLCVYSVWASKKNGEARLAEADRDQQIQVKRAAGRLDAAELNKKAAIVEAEAVAAQIGTIGTNLKEHSLYLQWQWIKMMEDAGHTTIYVPTEAGLPILEAGKHRTKYNEDNQD